MNRAPIAGLILLAVAGLAAARRVVDTDLRDLLITMRREDRCGFIFPEPTDLRQCPTYSLSISGDGTVIYEGRSGVKTVAWFELP